jgi:hypothetical protein
MLRAHGFIQRSPKRTATFSPTTAVKLSLRYKPPNKLTLDNSQKLAAQIFALREEMER